MVHIQDLIEIQILTPCRSSFQSSCSSTSDQTTRESSIHPNMRIQCNLLPLFLLGLVAILSIVEASTKKKKGKSGGKEESSNSLPLPSSLMIHMGQNLKFLFLKFPKHLIPLSSFLLIIYQWREVAFFLQPSPKYPQLLLFPPLNSFIFYS